MTIFEAIKNLNLPQGEYLVLGSGIMAALGIRPFNDIDLLVSPKLFEELRAEGWEYSEVEIEGRMRQVLTKGIADAYTDVWYGGISPDVEEMRRSAQIIEGVPFLPCERLLQIKKILRREKDLQDVTLIEKYLEKGKLS